MAIRLLPDGVYEFDTVNEAVEFRCAMTSTDNETAPIAANGPDFQGFLRALNDSQQKLAITLAETADDLTTEEVAERMDLSTTQIGPLLRHFREKAVKKFGIDEKFVRTEQVTRDADDGPVRVYRMIPKTKKEILAALKEPGQ